MKICKLLSAWVCSLGLLTSCIFESEMHFLQEPVDIDIDVHEETLGATKVYITANPKHKEVYYVWDVVPRSRIDSFDRSEKQYMELVLDGLYLKYIEWRHQKLETGEPFIGTFANQFMSYGNTHYFYTELTPDTDYYAWAFCVNSANNKPMGPLVKQLFHTKPESAADYRNPMSFDFEVNGMEVMIVPSVEDVDDYYAWSYIDTEELQQKYAGSLEAWALDCYQSRLEIGTLRQSLCLGIIKDQVQLTAGQTYILAATAYDANFQKCLYHLTFTYDGSEHFSVPRGHDQ